MLNDEWKMRELASRDGKAWSFRNMNGQSRGSGPAGGKVHQTEYLLSLGERVRRKRNACNYSRRQLSELSGVSERFIAHLELGQGNISVLRLKSIADALDVPLAEIIEDRQEPAKALNSGNLQPAAIAELFRHAEPSFQKAVLDLLMSARRTHAA